MSSRDPDELREELEDIDFSGYSDQLSVLRAEARKTVDAQRETLDDIDTKASKILRLNVALIGTLVSVVSLAIQFAPDSESGIGRIKPFVNVYTEVGIAALILSTAFAAVTYTASEVEVGVSSENLTNLLRANFSQSESEELLVKNYIMQINFNRSTNVRNIPLFQLTMVFAILAIISLVLGLYRGVIGAVPVWLLAVAVLLLFAVVSVSGIIQQTRRAIHDLREWY